MNDSNIIPLNKPEACDPLQTILKEGAQQLLAQAVEAEVASFLAKHNPQDGKATLVRNGYLPERTVQTGLGDIDVKIPKTRDRSQSGIKFNIGKSAGSNSPFTIFKTGKSIYFNFH